MVALDTPRFEVGSEKRFAEFISGLNDKDKIALVSHNDLDGLGSAKIVHEAVKADFVYLLNYEDLNESLIEDLKKKKVTKLIITDLSMDDVSYITDASKHFAILWIDHHRIMADVNSEKIVFLNPGGNNAHCATYLAYYLFSKITNLEAYDWLVACACLSDFTIKHNKNWLSQVFEKYGDFSDIKPMSLEDGKIQNLKRDLEYALIYFKSGNRLKEVFDSFEPDTIDRNSLKEYSDKVKKEVEDTLSLFETEKEVINERYLFSFQPHFGIGSIVSNSISINHPDKTVIIIRRKGDGYSVSMRRQDGGEDMNLLMKKVVSGLDGANGGGHIPAAGGHFLQKDLELFRKRLETI